MEHNAQNDVIINTVISLGHSLNIEIVAEGIETFEQERAKIREDEVLIIEGKVQRDDFAGEGKVRVVAERLP